jgi:hypothetical protein
MKRFQWFAKHKIITGIIVLFVIIVAASSSSAKNNTNSSNTASKSSTTASAKAPAVATPQPKAKEPAVPAEYKSALAKAYDYNSTAHMSKQGLYDQLTSDYGEKFSAAAAQYAIDNIKADWNANALAKAKEYQDQQHMSPSAIHDQLTSAYGEKFTVSEADYAIAHLNN